VPIVDVSALLGEDGRAIEATAREIGKAARSSGFLYVAGHGIPDSLIAAAYQQSKRFFALPEEEKLLLRIGSTRHHRGYVPTSDRGLYLDESGERHYEAFDLALDVAGDDPDSQESFLLGPNLWPQLPDFADIVSSYYDAVSRLANRLCLAFELDLGLEPGFFAERMRKPASQLRLIHYIENTVPDNNADMNMGAHTDYECFTILNQVAPGLQVMGLDNQWMEVPPIPGTFVINIGDILEAWTNGAYTATLHRVANHGRERFSLPYFAAVDEHVRVEPLARFVSDDRPAAYAPLVAGEHLLSQMVRDFSYMRERIAEGAMPARLLPKSELSQFEQRRPIAHASRQRIAA
jgi:isopenicillin N synthase-like dioxygenase